MMMALYARKLLLMLAFKVNSICRGNLGCKKAANAVIKKITDISEERQSTAQERENVARQIQTFGGPEPQWKMHVLETVAITVAAVLLMYVVGGFVLPPIINMSIAIVGMIIGIGIAISFAVNKQ